MSENLDDDLDYGHLSRTQYVRNRSAWLSTRSANRAISRSGICGQECNWIAEESSTLSDHDHTAKDVIRKARGISKAHPELVPAWPTLEDVANDPKVHFKRLQEEKPVPAQHLAFGFASAPERKIAGVSSRRVPVVAFPKGPDGTLLCVMELRRSRAGWKESRELWLETFQLRDGVATHYPGPGPRIRQLVFAAPRDQSATLLAVRYPMSISILRPRFASDYDTMEKGYRSTRIKLEHLTAISTESSVSTISYMAFSPHNQHHLATIDTQGVWTVFEIQVRSRAPERSLTKPVHRGQASPSTLLAALRVSSRNRTEDNYRLSWISNSEKLVIFSHRNSEIYSLGATRLDDLYDFDRGMGGSLLDLKRLPTNDRDMFLLTTESFIWLRYGMKNFAPSSVDPEVGGFVKLFSWRHHLPTNDQTLGLALCERSAVSLSVFIICHQAGHAIELRLRRQSEPALRLVQLEEAPLRFRIPHSVFNQFAQSASQSRHVLADLYFMRVTLGAPLAKKDEVEHPYTMPNIFFYQVFALSTRLGLGGFVIYHLDTGKSRDSAALPSLQQSVKRFEWTMTRQFPIILKQTRIEDKFVVNSSHSSDGDSISAEASDDINGLKYSAGPNTVANEAWSISNKMIYDRIAQARGKTEEVSSWIDELFSSLELTSDRATGHLRTLASFAPVEIIVHDMDKASGALARFLPSSPVAVSLSSRVLVAPLGGNKHLTLDVLRPDRLTLFPLYSRLLGEWLKPLPDQLFTQGRLIREKLARQVAVMLLASSVGVRSNGASITQRFSHDPSQGQSNEPRTTSSNMDTVNNEHDEEVVNRHTNHDALRAAIEGLGRYAVIQPADEGKSNQTLGNIAAHWQLGSDPAKYNYEDTAARLTGRTLIGGSRSISAAENDRRQRRLGKRQALEAIRASRKAARQSVLAFSQPADVPGRDMTSSQPRAVDVRAFGQLLQLSSSQSQPAAVASQVVAGRFGGRPSAAVGAHRKASKRKGF